MNEQSRAKVSDLRVRLCFLVNILNTRGRSDEAGISTASSLRIVTADSVARLGTSRSSLDLVGSGTCDDCNGANGSDDK